MKNSLHFNRCFNESTDHVVMHWVLKSTRHFKCIAAGLTLLLKSIDSCFRCLFLKLIYQIIFEDSQRLSECSSRFDDVAGAIVSLVCTQANCNLACWIHFRDQSFWLRLSFVWSASASLHDQVIRMTACKRTGSASLAVQEPGRNEA